MRTRAFAVLSCLNFDEIKKMKKDKKVGNILKSDFDCVCIGSINEKNDAYFTLFL